jgi:phosphoglycerate kinase
VKIFMATDVVAADDFSPTANTQVVDASAIPAGWQGLDAGPNSIAMFKEVIENSGTILWNGPVGVFEFEKFAVGSKAVGEAIVTATSKGAFSLVGGGDSVACVNQFGFDDGVSYISTAGGALLEYLEGQVLPGIAAVRGE